jgi:hypothetical protein
MQFYTTAVSHGTTGVKTRTVGFQPKGARILIGTVSGGETDLIHESDGVTDGINQICDSFLHDNTGLSFQDRFTDRLASHYEFDGSGNPDEVVKVIFDSFTSTEFKYNVITANGNYQLRVEVWG